MMSSAIERRRRATLRAPGGRGPARRAGAGRLDVAGHCRGVAHPPAASRSIGSGPHRRAARQRLCAGFPADLCERSGLDPNEVARRFKAEAATVNQKTELTFPAPVPARGVPAGAVVLLGVVLAVGAYAGWYRLRARAGCRPRPAPGADAPGVRWPSRRCRRRPAADSQSPPRLRRRRPSPLGAAGRGGTAGSVDLAQFGGGRAGSGAAARSRQSDQSRILLRANADAWVLVRDRAGPVLLNRILHAGETWEVPAQAEPAAHHWQRRGHRSGGGRRGNRFPGRQRRGAARSAAGSRPDQGWQAGVRQPSPPCRRDAAAQSPVACARRAADTPF